MAVLTSEHAGTAWTTDRVGYKAVGETYTLVGYAVNVGCLDVALVVGTNGLIRVVVTHDEEDVHRLLRSCGLLFLVASGTGGKAC